ncbi:MarR family winged helix-turn-helix transcriptional regulator [Dietzia sp. 179-F 9C3 NHS]|uniref:MarR family winged helix-turn-helix transcriptional regulator n=1 Tax=Dietzia sp. 179-F 9C3 NHS TaxID=3374295 RepID=UPI00387A4CD3
MTHPDDPDSPADPADPAALAAELRDALRPLWRRFNAHRTLSLGKIGILSHLAGRGPLTATELAGLERISHQAIANAVRELEELGLIRRSPDPDDGRRVLVELTDPGRERLRVEQSAGQDWLARSVADHLDDADRATIAAAIPLLRRLDADTLDTAAAADAAGSPGTRR